MARPAKNPKKIERRALGVCTKCAVPLDDQDKKLGFVTCKRCRDKWRLEYYPNSTRGLSRRPQGDRGKNHDCWQCGCKLPEGYTKKKCEACIDKSRQGLLETNRRKRHENLYQRPDNKQSEV